ncbi:MAG: beta propeller repeat protein, partial [Mycobacteriales bacterium]
PTGSCQLLARLSVNGGRSFPVTRVIDALDNPGATKVGYVTFGHTVFAYDPGLYRSVDDGQHWQRVALPGPGRVLDVGTTSAGVVW